MGQINTIMDELKNNGICKVYLNQDGRINNAKQQIVMILQSDYDGKLTVASRLEVYDKPLFIDGDRNLAAIPMGDYSLIDYAGIDIDHALAVLVYYTLISRKSIIIQGDSDELNKNNLAQELYERVVEMLLVLNQMSEESLSDSEIGIENYLVVQSRDNVHHVDIDYETMEERIQNLEYSFKKNKLKDEVQIQQSRGVNNQLRRERQLEKEKNTNPFEEQFREVIQKETVVKLVGQDEDVVAGVALDALIKWMDYRNINSLDTKTYIHYNRDDDCIYINEEVANNTQSRLIIDTSCLAKDMADSLSLWLYYKMLNELDLSIDCEKENITYMDFSNNKNFGY